MDVIDLVVVVVALVVVVDVVLHLHVLDGLVLSLDASCEAAGEDDADELEKNK